MHRTDNHLNTQYDERGQGMAFVSDRIQGQQVPDEVYKKEDPLLPLPGHAQSSPAESAGVMKWMKGKGSKFHRKLIWLNRRHLTQGVDASGKNAVNQEDQRQTAEHKETILKSLLVCKAELAENKQGRAGSNAISLHASSSGLSPRSPYAQSQGFSGANTSPTRILAARQHDPVPSPKKPYVLIELRQPEEVQAVLAAVHDKRGLPPFFRTGTRQNSINVSSDDRRYILCTLAWEKLKGRSWWSILAENARNKIGQRWKLFTLKETAHNFDERLEMDLHTPSKLRDAVPPQILPAAAAPDAVEEWLTILQQYFIKEVRKTGVKVITGRGLDTRGVTYRATEKRLAILWQQQRLVSNFQGDGGALTVWLLEPAMSRW